MTDPTTRPLAAIVLAAGKGTRMKSDTHKVLHPIAGRPMLLHLLAAVGELAPERVVVVTGAGREQVEAAVAPLGIATALQAEQLGTGHAVRQAEAALDGFAGDVLVLYGDVPLVTAATMRRMLDRLRGDDAPAAVVLGFRPADPGAYGRVIADAGGRIDRMVEYKDATDAERAETLCNSGLMAARAEDLWALLARVGNDNAAGEYYLPDVVMLASADGRGSAVIETSADEVAGVNSRGELAAVEAGWQAIRRIAAMRDGVTLVAPDTVWFSHDTMLGRDVTVEPNVVFGPGVSVADGATIHAFSHLEGATVGKGAEVGPYARLRPGAVMGAKSKVGNFVEMKKAVLGEGAKASHLTYLGDADVGPGANIGAGTITCNYDGYLKYRTTIGAGAFIGSNSALVAPVSIGAGAIVGAGSVVTGDVEADALALGRARQENRLGWAARFRDMMRAKKAARQGRGFPAQSISPMIVSMNRESDMGEAPLVAGVELGGTKCICILARGPDDIEDRVQLPTTRPEETLSAIEAVLDRWQGFSALGIASFGPVSIDRASHDYGHITSTPKPGWAGQDVAARLRRHAGVPTGFHTDVVGAALAEARWGAAKGLDDIAYATVGTGIGVGLIAGGRPVDGLTHSEFGHVRPVRLPGDDWVGNCPYHGACLEGLAAGPAIAARTGIPGDQLAADDPAWDTIAHALGQLLHVLVLTGVPRRIVMGGGVMVGTDHLFPRVRAAMAKSLAGYIALPEVGDPDTYVVPPALGGNAGPLGAIVLGAQALGEQLQTSFTTR